VLTLPGSYHSGFSTGLNIGEAVNFASKSWLPFGVKAQNIYRRTREKIPVFPYEWLLIQNILNLDSVKLDAESLNQILKSYDIWFRIEKENRQRIEKEMAAMSFSEAHKFAPQVMADAGEVPEDAH